MKDNNSKIVDLRSDTITKPSPKMWEAVKQLDNSLLGDDVLQEDPTVNALEKKAAELTGKEAALFVTSGAQGNLISVLSHTNPGEEILLEELSHIFYYEVGTPAVFGGLLTKTFSSNKGIVQLEKLEPLIRPRNDIHQPWTTLLCLENTHNKHGGTVIPVDYLKKVKFFTKQHDLKFHLDGARIFNAAVSKNRSVKDFTQHVDSVMFCLSKGLSCPVGSIVAGNNAFIDKARRYRKMLGGGWRQAGILASFGLVALENKWIQRLQEDHINAKRLAAGLAGVHSAMKVETPETNILMVEFPKKTDMPRLMAKLNKRGIKAFNMKNKIRFVTHYGITATDIEYSVEQITKVAKGIL